jgi:hypothetical protein
MWIVNKPLLGTTFDYMLHKNEIVIKLCYIIELLSAWFSDLGTTYHAIINIVCMIIRIYHNISIL